MSHIHTPTHTHLHTLTHRRIQTFNGLARVLGMDEVMAIKAFKSMKAAQEWGGPAEGMELSFQWAPLPQAAESRRRRAYCLVGGRGLRLCVLVETGG